MKTVRLTLTDQDRARLTHHLRDKSLPWQAVKRLEAIRLLDKGCTTQMVAQQLAIRKELVRKYCAEFTVHGFDGLIRLEKPGKETLLTEAMFCALDMFARQQKQQKKRCVLKDLTRFLLQEYGVSMSEEWLSKRLVMRKRERKSQPWR